MSGRTVIVTGASSGLGYEVARYLCEGGNDVILACRNKDKAERAIEKIKRANPNAMATFMELDLASKASIEKFVEEFQKSERKLHVLVNNAGLALGWKDTKIQLTEDNFELTMGTNHLGPFMLTQLLLDDLKKAAAEENGEARIIMVTSSMHNPEAMKRRNNVQPLDLEDFFLYKEGAFNGLQAYKNSKLANIMFAYEMAKKLDGTKVTINAVNPGFVPSTDLMRSASGTQKFFARVVMHTLLRFTKITRTPAQGAQAICNLITDEKYKDVTGKYFDNGAEATSSEESNDEEKQKKVWELSGGYLHMEGFEELEIPTPPPPKEEKKEEKKEEATAAAAEGETKEGEEGEKKEGEEAEKKEGEAKKEESADAEKKEDNKTDEEKEQKKEDTEEDKKEEVREEEKKDEEKEKEEEKPAEEIKEEIKEDVKSEEKATTEATEKPAAKEEVAA